MARFLGIDIGTSSAKSLIIDEAGRVLGAGSAGYPLHHPRPLWSEQDPLDWWRGVTESMRAAAAASGVSLSEITAIGLSGQMHGSVLLDEPTATSGGALGEALRPALLWNDQRTARECEEILTAAGGKTRLVEVVGNAALPGFTLPKLLWVRRHEPAVWARVRVVLMPKDYVRFRLTGELVTDVGDAAGTLLFDVDRRGWHASMCERVGIDASMLPRVLESGATSGRVSAWCARETGLSAGIPVAGGSGDNQAGAIGAGVVSPGAVLAALGTSGVIYAHAAEPRRDLPEGRLHTMCAADGHAGRRGAWCVTGVTLSAAGSLQWVRDRLFPQASFDELLLEAASAPPGCDGLLFLPYLTGERCPHPDPQARGGWIGLTASHTRAHMLRAVLEGVTFSMGEIVDIVRSVGVPVSRIVLGGGGAKSAFWRQLQADVFGQPVTLPNTEEGPALGAAILGGVACGHWPDVGAACGAIIRDTETRDPGDNRARYVDPRRVFAAAYGAVNEVLRT